MSERTPLDGHCAHSRYTLSVDGQRVDAHVEQMPDIEGFAKWRGQRWIFAVNGQRYLGPPYVPLDDWDELVAMVGGWLRAKQT